MLIIKDIFGSLSNAKLKGSSHVLLDEGSVKIWSCSCWEKGNFIMINEFKCGQTWKIWPSPLSLSLYNPFKDFAIFWIKKGLQERCFSVNIADFYKTLSVAASAFFWKYFTAFLQLIIQLSCKGVKRNALVMTPW